MPAAYAHHRFGEECIEGMPEKLKKIVTDHRELFDFGVHGPDILFYYDPLKKNAVNGWGGEMHHHSGREFFEHCLDVYRDHEEKAEMLAYMLGFLAHFTLDSCCHGYINEQTESLGLSHNYIESQYEVYLMRQDEKEPMKVDRSAPLKPTRKTATVISYFFDFKPEEILKTLKGQKSTLKLFYSPREKKKKLVRGIIHAAKIGGSFDDLFLDEEEHFLCTRTNRNIFAMQQDAAKKYPELLKNLMQYLLGEAELCEYFEHDFEGGIVEKGRENV